MCRYIWVLLIKITRTKDDHTRIYVLEKALRNSESSSFLIYEVKVTGCQYISSWKYASMHRQIQRLHISRSFSFSSDQPYVKKLPMAVHNLYFKGKMKRTLQNIPRVSYLHS